VIRPLLIALQFLTRVPVRLNRLPAPGEVGRSLLYYPLVGLLLGLLLATLAGLLAGLPSLLGAALLLVAWVLLTGALHLDGLADTCDAWAGGHGERERTLAVMKDPRSGPMGVTAVVLVLLVKFAALCALLDSRDLAALVLAPLLGRVALPLLFLTTPYVRPGGLGASLATEAPRGAAAAVVVIGLAAIPMLAGRQGFIAVLGALAAFLYLRAAMHRRIGGTTGDTAGALVELTEVSVIVSIALALSIQ
jgi:adenosylcobinamide-GDP ribazoletransferase